MHSLVLSNEACPLTTQASLPTAGRRTALVNEHLAERRVTEALAD